jgi:hypothetical protein
MPTSSTCPSAGSKQLSNLKGQQKRLVVILKEDFNFDVIVEIVKQYHKVERAKRIKPLEKARLVHSYLNMLLPYCVPKQMHEKEAGPGTGDKIQFNISIGGGNPTDTLSQKGGDPDSHSNVSITIPTVKQPDGSFAVDTPKEI